MSLKNTIFYATDERYFDYTYASISSFVGTHSLDDWQIVVGDIGMTDEQLAVLSKVCKIIPFKPFNSLQQHGIIYPATEAKLQMLATHQTAGCALLLMDSDTLFLDNIDSFVKSFLEAPENFAILIENLPEWERSRASYGWREKQIPECFARRDEWKDYPMCNAGVFFSKGTASVQLGKAALEILGQYGNDVIVAEQTVIVSLLYDQGIPFINLPVRYNCVAWEQFIGHYDGDINYVTSKPHFREEVIAIRHFAWDKKPLDAALNFLKKRRNF